MNLSWFSPIAPQIWHAYHIAGEQMATGIIGALIHRERSGEGQDVSLAIHEAVIPRLNSHPHPSPLLRALVAGGQLGARSGHGFLGWPQGARERTAARLADHITCQLESIALKGKS